MLSIDKKSVLSFLIFNLLLTFLLILPEAGYGQEDSVKNFKNTIRYNISNPVLFDAKFIIVGYERVINDHQTISLSIGRPFLPGFSFMSDSLGLSDQFNDKGFHISFDYRFYLHKENKYKAPRGVYLGPYFAFNSFSRDLSWNINTQTFTGQAVSGYTLNASLLGMQLGYQFVFWDRLSLDLVLMGPGWWHLNLKSRFETDLPAEDENMLIDQLNELLKEKFPSSSFIIGNNFETSKNASTNVMGLRYMINVGFRF